MTTASRPTAVVVIPCLNEADAIGPEVTELLAVAADPALPVEVTAVIVVDNGSTDATAEVAQRAGATVVSQPIPGYGRACLAGVLAAGPVDIIVLMDGDHCDEPRELPDLLRPLLAGKAGLVIGSRMLGHHEPGSLLPQQIVGNRVAALLVRVLYGVRLTDIGPFRVIRRDDLLRLGMREMTYGWSVEMIVRASRSGLTVAEVPATWRRRVAGESKVSGNLRASVRAGFRIISAIFRARSDRQPLPPELARAIETPR